LRRLQLGGWEVCGGAVQPSVVEPVDVLEGGDLDLLDGPPRTPGVDQLSLVSPIVELGLGVVEGIADLLRRSSLRTRRAVHPLRESFVTLTAARTSGSEQHRRRRDAPC
jgi:hypothetical protein